MTDLTLKRPVGILLHQTSTNFPVDHAHVVIPAIYIQLACNAQFVQASLILQPQYGYAQVSCMPRRRGHC